MVIIIFALKFVMPMSVIVWFAIIFYRGRFWRSDQYLSNVTSPLPELPKIVAIIPARNEQLNISQSVLSLLRQDYKGALYLIIVDDNSEDGTLKILGSISEGLDNIFVIEGKKTPIDWTGKTWAMAQGVELAKKQFPDAKYYLFTDSDILHHRGNVTELVSKAMNENLALVSLMVKLRCISIWEFLLIPAFIFFFQKLYPFSLVNNPKKSIAAAAGGCMLIDCKKLEKSGGLEVIKTEIIDDCALAKNLKQSNSIWIGLTKSTKSLRSYSSLRDIARMVARTAFVQLNYSIFNLFATIIGMLVIYTFPLMGLLIGILIGEISLFVLGVMSLAMMFAAYIPTLKLYNRSIWEACLLPIAAFIYTVMTVLSAWQYLYGDAPTWKGRSLAKVKK